MDKLTIDEVAKLAFVSRSVVSRVLNNHPSVSDEARTRVLRVIKKYNYVPSSVARSLVTNRTYEIGLLIPRRAGEVLAGGFWSLLLLGITEQCEEEGYHVTLCLVSSRAECERGCRASQNEFDGCIVLADAAAEAAAAALEKRNVPVVIVGCNPQLPDLSSVDVCNVEGGYRATKHLLSLGHRAVGLITGIPGAQETRDRLEGYRQALREAGLSFRRELVVNGDYTERSGYEAAKRMLNQGAKATAVFCMSDAMAMGALLAFHEAGLQVPSDVSVVGYDDVPTAAFAVPPLTTVRQPLRELGRRAAKLVIAHVEDRDLRPVHEALSVDLIVRKTSAPPNRQIPS